MFPVDPIWWGYLLNPVLVVDENEPVFVVALVALGVGTDEVLHSMRATRVSETLTGRAVCDDFRLGAGVHWCPLSSVTT